MIALQMTDVKKTMNTLLMTATFDQFHVQEIRITKDVSFHLDGRLHRDYYSEDELSERPELFSQDFALYADLREQITSLIQGKNTPLSFQFVLSAPASYLGSLTSNPAFTGNPEDIRDLILTFRFERGRLTCLTAVSLQNFSLDKSIDELWDKAICKSFEKTEIPYEIL